MFLPLSLFFSLPPPISLSLKSTTTIIVIIKDSACVKTQSCPSRCPEFSGSAVLRQSAASSRGGAGDSAHVNVPSQRAACSGLASQPGAGENSDVAVWAEPSPRLRNLAADAPPGPSSVALAQPSRLLRLGVPGPELEVLWAGTGLAAAEDKDALGSPLSPRKKGRHYLGVGTGLQGSKNFQKTEQPIVSFLSLESHLMHRPHKVLYCGRFQDQLQM